MSNPPSEITLRNWSIRVSNVGLPYLIARTVHNHPHIGTGPYGHSTPIIWIDVERGICSTLNTLYYLEDPMDDVGEPDIQDLISKLHPDNVPPEIRRVHANRKPYPGTTFEEDVVAHWNIERWTDLRKGVDFLVEEASEPQIDTNS